MTSYFLLMVDNQGNVRNVNRLCCFLLYNFFDNYFYKNNSTEKLVVIYQYIINLFCSTPDEQQKLVTCISHLSGVNKNKLHEYCFHNPTGLIPLLEFVNSYQVGLPNVNLNWIIGNIFFHKDFLDNIRSITPNFLSEENVIHIINLLLEKGYLIDSYIKYFTDYTDISSVAQKILVNYNNNKIFKRENDKKYYLRSKTGLLSDKVLQQNEITVGKDNSIMKPLSLFLSSNNNFDLLYCLVYYPKLVFAGENLYENIYDKYSSIGITGSFQEIVELLTVLGDLLVENYNISVPLFLVLMKTGKTPHGFYSDPAREQTDKYIMDVYLALNQKIGEIL